MAEVPTTYCHFYTDLDLAFSFRVVSGLELPTPLRFLRGRRKKQPRKQITVYCKWKAIRLTLLGIRLISLSEVTKSGL